ncbi:MAG: hypothetical protein H7831_13810 [Magnetococcus sp. WYHC-3]
MKTAGSHGLARTVAVLVLASGVVPVQADPLGMMSAPTTMPMGQTMGMPFGSGMNPQGMQYPAQAAGAMAQQWGQGAAVPAMGGWGQSEATSGQAVPQWGAVPSQGMPPAGGDAGYMGQRFGEFMRSFNQGLSATPGMATTPSAPGSPPAGASWMGSTGGAQSAPQGGYGSAPGEYGAAQRYAPWERPITGPESWPGGAPLQQPEMMGPEGEMGEDPDAYVGQYDPWGARYWGWDSMHAPRARPPRGFTASPGWPVPSWDTPAEPDVGMPPPEGGDAPGVMRGVNPWTLPQHGGGAPGDMWQYGGSGGGLPPFNPPTQRHW